MNMFPNFNAWHKVPKDADIPAQTPYFTARGNDIVAHVSVGWAEPHEAEGRDPSLDYYTEERIPSPEEEKIEQRARAMYYAVPGSDTWEYEDEYTQEAWLDLARKYVEK